MKDIGRKIMEARKRRNLPQRVLAERLNVNHSIVVQYEKGKHTPRLSTLERISAALGCDLSELLSPEEMILLKCTDSSIEQAKSLTIRRAIESYIHENDIDPLISKDGEVGELVYNAVFKDYQKNFLGKLLQIEKIKRYGIFHPLTHIIDAILDASEEMIGKDGLFYEFLIRDTFSNIEEIKQLPLKDEYLNLIRSVRKGAIKSFPFDTDEGERERVKKELQENLSDFLDKCWEENKGVSQ